MTAFKTKYGLFKWFVIPFGLVNVFNIFQKIYQLIFQRFFDEFCSVYVDDKLIYIDNF